MNISWKNLLVAFGAQAIEPCDVRFNSGANILEANCRIIPLTFFGVISCYGPDATTFLHNQLTNDVLHLGIGKAQRATWCSPKGRMIASFVVVRHANKIDDFKLLVSSDLADDVANRLKKYILRSQVKIDDDSSQWLCFGLLGSNSLFLQQLGLKIPDTDFRVSYLSKAIVVRLSANRVLLIVAVAEAEEMFTKLCKAGAIPASSNYWRAAMIEEGIPLITAALREELVPQMADFDRIGAVSFQKGCYPGQEIIARTRYLGKVKRRLFKLYYKGELFPGTPLFSPQANDAQHACGIIVNSAASPNLGVTGSMGLGVLFESAAGGEIHLNQLDGPLVEVIPINYPD